MLEGTKSVTGTELKDGQFSFQLKDSTGKVIETVTNAADGSFAFSELKFTEADAGKTYEYTITEVNDGQAGYTYDSHTCTVTIKVTDNGDGTLAVTPTYSGGATFTNPYKPLATSAPFTATKQLTGKTLAAGMFTFELKDANGKVVATATNNADGTVDFGSIEFTEAGTYTFTATEVAGTDKNMTYDGSTKTYTVTVTDNNGQLKAEVSCSDSTFKNTYTPPEEPPVPPKPPVVPETGDATSLVGMGAFAAAGAAAILGALRLRRRDD